MADPALAFNPAPYDGCRFQAPRAERSRASTPVMKTDPEVTPVDGAIGVQVASLRSLIVGDRAPVRQQKRDVRAIDHF